MIFSKQIVSHNSREATGEVRVAMGFFNLWMLQATMTMIMKQRSVLTHETCAYDFSRGKLFFTTGEKATLQV